MRRVYFNGNFESKYVYDSETNELLLRISSHPDKTEKFNIYTGEFFEPMKPMLGTVIVEWQEPDTDYNLNKLYTSHDECRECHDLGYWVDKNGMRTKNEEDNYNWITDHCNDFKREWESLKNFWTINKEIIERVLSEHKMTTVDIKRNEKIKV